MMSVVKNLVVAIVLLLPMISHSQTQGGASTTQKEQNMLEKQKEIVRRIFEEVLNKRNFTLLEGIVSPDYPGPQGTKGVEGFKTPILPVIAAFPDIQWHLLDIIAEGNKVTAKWVVKGTHSNTYLNIPATNKKVSIPGMGFYEFVDGKVRSSDVLTDRMGLLEQLGISMGK